MGLWATAQKISMLVWRCHQLLFWFLANDHLPREYCHCVCLLMIKLVMWNRGLRTDLLAFILRLRITLENLRYEPFDEGCENSKMGSNGLPLPPNDVWRIVSMLGRETWKETWKWFSNAHYSCKFILLLCDCPLSLIGGLLKCRGTVGRFQNC